MHDARGNREDLGQVGNPVQVRIDGGDPVEAL